MARVALLTAHQPRTDLPALPRASLEAGGLSLLERLIRQCRACGIERILILSDPQFEYFQPILANLCQTEDIAHVARASDLVGRIAPDDEVLVFEEGVALDSRVLDQVLRHEAPRVLACFEDPNIPSAMRLDPNHSFASVLKADGTFVRDVCRGLGEWSLVQTLVRALVPHGLFFPVHSIPLYISVRAKEVPLLWQPMFSAAEDGSVSAKLLAALSSQGVTWSQRLIVQPLAGKIVSQILPLKLSPYSIGYVKVLTGLGVLMAFGQGWVIGGALIALCFGILSDAQSQYEDVTIRAGPSPLLSAKRLADKGVLYGACAGIAADMAARGLPGAWWLLVLWVLTDVTSTAHHDFFRWYTGKKLEDWNLLERRLAFCKGDLSAYFLCFILFALGGGYGFGYIFVVCYSIMTFILAQLGFFVRLREYGASAERLRGQISGAAF